MVLIKGKFVEEHILNVKTFKWHLNIKPKVVRLLGSLDGESGGSLLN